MMKFLHLFILFLLMLSASRSAFATIEQTDLLEIKAKLEDSITKKYNNRISTRIRSEFFSVGAQVTLAVQKELVDASSIEQKNPAGYFSELPADISLGIMGSLPKSVEGSVAGEQQGNGTKVLKEKIKIVQILVHVGLSPKLGKDYQDQFNVWLNNNIKTEFGGIGKASVNNYMEVEPSATDDTKNPKVFELKMEPKSIEINAQQPTAPRLLGWEERFGQFQNFIGLSLLALIMMITFIVSKYIPSRDVKNQLAVAERLAELKSTQSLNESYEASTPQSLAAPKTLTSETFEAENKSGNSRLVTTYESFQELQRKIAYLVLSSKENMQLVTQMWLDDGEMGRAKIALVLDSVLANIGKVETLSKTAGEHTPDWMMPESIRLDKGLSKVFQSVATLDLESKSEFLDKAYWDLLSIQTVGINLTKQRFSAFAQLPASTIHKILGAQDHKIKTLTFLHLPPEKLKQVLATMSLDDKKVIMDQAFSNPNLSDHDVDQVNSSLNVLIQREKLKNVNSVDLPSLVPNLLAVMTPLEEIQLISQIVTAKPDSAKFLMTNYPSIFFLNIWPADLLKLLLSRARNTQSLALIQAMPELKDLILGVLPGKSQAMLKEDLGVKVLSDEELNVNLQEIRVQLLQMLENNEIDLVQIFNSSETSTSNVAA